ncbi:MULTISPECIES: hypothetical protein [unclassified Streptomyces]
MALCLLGLLLQLDRQGASGGGRQTGIVAILLVAFAALFTLTVIQLWRHTRTAHCSTAKRLTPSV